MPPNAANRVRALRQQQGLTQAELATRAGISRTAVTAIEADQIIPSVTAALGIALALGTTVEQLFGSAPAQVGEPVWGATVTSATIGWWAAEVGPQTVLYPAGTAPLLTPLPDGLSDQVLDSSGLRQQARDTLVLACCDPAVGLLASLYQQQTGLRLLVLPRSSGESLRLLREGLVHLAGVHFSTADDPHGNLRAATEAYPRPFQLLRMATWREGIVSQPGARLRSVRSAVKSRLNWIGREPGSGAAHCLELILPDHGQPKYLARNHRGVVEAIQSGWAEAGVCVELASAEAGLAFLPVQEEAYELCIPADLIEDRRVQALLQVVRGAEFRKLLSQVIGYQTQQTGDWTSGSADATAG